jgi:hypothetical protein
MGYGLKGWGLFLDRGQKFSLLHSLQIRSEANQPSIQRLSGAHLLGIKRPERESDHSLPTSVKVKNGGATPSLSHMSLTFYMLIYALTFG